MGEIEQFMIEVHTRWLGFMRQRASGGTTVEDILQEACKTFDVSVSGIRGASRAKRLLDARKFVCVRLRDMGFNYSEIGRAIGRHTSTVLHTFRQMED